MPRRKFRGTGLRLSPPKEGTWFIAAILWLIGFADVILGVFHLPGNFGVWALILAGLLLIIASIVDGL